MALDLNKRLSLNFTLREFVVSQTAFRHNIDNTPPPSAILNMEALCLNVLQPVRDLIEKPIIITSGYRCPELNKLIGGATNSCHLYGQAADIIVPDMTPQELLAIIYKSVPKFHELILEFNAWVHISYRRNKPNQGKLLMAKRNDYGRVVYLPLYPEEIEQWL